MNTLVNAIPNRPKNLVQNMEALAKLTLTLVAAATSILLLPIGITSAHSSTPSPAAVPALYARSVETMPVFIVAPSSAPAGTDQTITVQVQQAPTTLTYVKVSCDHPELMSSPSGSWPYMLPVPAGSSAVSFPVTTRGTQTSTSIAVFACQASLDITNPANHQAENTMTLTPGTSKSEKPF